jgi:long-chain fatty acid transport protein
LLVALLAPAAAWAGPYEVFGTGPRAIAMGGAYAALGEDIAGVYYNVAALTQVERLEFELGYVYGEPHITINGARQNVDLNHGTNLGGVGSTVVLGHRMSIGANVFMPDDHMMRFLVLPINHAHFTLFANANHTIVSMVGGGFEIFPWMSVGVGTSILANNIGGVNFAINETKPSRGSLNSNIGNYFSPIAGLWFKPTDWWRIGVSYREKLEMRLVLPNTITIPPVTGFPNSGVPILRESYMTILAYTWSHFSPRQFEFGTAFKPIERLVLSADLTYMQWSQMRTDAPYSFVYLTGGLADAFPTKIGPLPEGPHARDTLNPAAGVEYRAVSGDWATLDVRAGYHYRATPIPAQTGQTNYLDSSAHIFSAGLGFAIFNVFEALPRPLSLDAYFQYQKLEDRTFHKKNPTDPIGDMEIGGYWWNVGGSLTMRF